MACKAEYQGIYGINSVHKWWKPSHNNMKLKTHGNWRNGYQNNVLLTILSISTYLPFMFVHRIKRKRYRKVKIWNVICTDIKWIFKRKTRAISKQKDGWVNQTYAFKHCIWVFLVNVFRSCMSCIIFVLFDLFTWRSIFFIVKTRKGRDSLWWYCVICIP